MVGLLDWELWSAADQAKRSVLLTKIGVMVACSSVFKPVPRLIE